MPIATKTHLTFTRVVSDALVPGIIDPAALCLHRPLLECAGRRVVHPLAGGVAVEPL